MGIFSKRKIDLTALLDLEVIAISPLTTRLSSGMRITGPTPPPPPRHLSDTESAELTKLAKELCEWLDKYLESKPENPTNDAPITAPATSGNTEVASSTVQTPQAFFQPHSNTDSPAGNEASSKPSLQG